MLKGSELSCSQLGEKMRMGAGKGLEKPKGALSPSRATIPRSDLRQSVPSVG